MKIQNTTSGKIFDVSEDEWRNIIVASGNDYKYNVVEDNVPVEIKRLKPIEMKPKNKKND